MKRLFLFFISLSVFACTKNRDMYEEPNYDSVNTFVAGMQTITDVVSIADSAMRWDEDSTTFRNIRLYKVITGDNTTLTLDFGDTTDTDPDKKKRAGLISIDYPSHYPIADDLFTLSFNNFQVNASVYSGTCEIHLEERDGNRSVFHIHESDITQSVFGKRIAIEAALELHSEGLNAPCWTLGTWIASGDLKYTTSINDSIYLDAITHYYERGKCSLVSDQFNALINYGDGQEDYLATATSDLFRYIIEQKAY